MNRKFQAALLPAIVLLAQCLLAQTQPKLSERPNAKPEAKSVASSSSAVTVLPSEETVNSFLFQTFGYDPTITWKVSDIRPSEIPGLAEVNIVITTPQGANANRLFVSADGKHAITGDVLPFGAKPYEEAREKIAKGPLNGPAKGPANAPVTIVEFSDMQCPHCQKAAPAVESLLAQEPEVHFVFQNFPLPLHNWAEKGAAYVDCVGHASNDGVWKFIDKTFEDQANITEANADEKLKAIATAAGVNGDEIAACAAKPETKSHIEASLALGKSLGVTGTPTLFINGRSVGATAPVETLKKIVDFEVSQEKGTQEKPAK